MEIWNHFTFRKDMHPLITRYILENGIQHHYGEIMSSIDICEDDPHWKNLSQLLKIEHNTYRSETRFSKDELLSAEWLTMRSIWHYDYPQPESNYRSFTYREECICPNDDCGMDKIQKDSFRFKRTPKWGRRNFCMTNWVYDELFVSPRARELLETSNLQGFSFLDVKNKSGRDILADIYQMQIPYILPHGMIESKSFLAEVHICSLCGKKKYRANGRGQFVFNRGIFENVPDFVKSEERFGSGLVATRLILVNQKVYRFILEHKLDSSLVFQPILLV